MYFAATEDLFRKRALGRLIRWFGAFPKRKAASDIAALRSIFSIIDKGGLVGVFPEGVRTWDGTNQPLFTGIAKLIRKLGVPVYVCRLEGAYLVYPRWARRWRRLPIRGVFSRLYEASEHPRGRRADPRRTSPRPSAAPITSFPSLRRRAAGRARGERDPRAVPLPELRHDGRAEARAAVLSTNMIECSSCFSTWSVDAGCRLSAVDENGRPEGRWTTLADYYDRIRAMPLTPIRSELRLGLAPEERIFLISRPRFLFKQERFPNLRVFAFGRAFLTSERLLFRTRLGLPLAMPLTSVGALSVDPGDRLHFTYEGKLYRIPFRNESALKWFDTILRQQAEIRARKAAG